LRSIKENWGKVAVIHIDSHLDTWDPKIIGGRLSEYAGYNHGTFLSHAHSEGLILGTSVHLGTRARVSNPRYNLDHDRSCGFLIIPARDIDSIGVEGVIKKIKGRVGKSKAYISVDIDVLDPASCFCPRYVSSFALESHF
jgi:agmatinase